MFILRSKLFWSVNLVNRTNDWHAFKYEQDECSKLKDRACTYDLTRIRLRAACTKEKVRNEMTINRRDVQPNDVKPCWKCHFTISLCYYTRARCNRTTLTREFTGGGSARMCSPLVQLRHLRINDGFASIKEQRVNRLRRRTWRSKKRRFFFQLVLYSSVVSGTFLGSRLSIHFIFHEYTREEDRFARVRWANFFAKCLEDRPLYILTRYPTIPVSKITPTSTDLPYLSLSTSACRCTCSCTSTL